MVHALTYDVPVTYRATDKDMRGIIAPLELSTLLAGGYLLACLTWSYPPADGNIACTLHPRY